MTVSNSQIIIPTQWLIDPGIVFENVSKLGLPMPMLAMPIWEGVGSRVFNYGGIKLRGELPATGIVWDSSSLSGACLKGSGGAGDTVDTNWQWRIGTGPFTFACWYKGTESTDYAGFMGAAIGGSVGAILMLKGSKLSGWINNVTYEAGSAQINDDKWHHLVFMRDGTIGRLYTDGVQQGTDFAVVGTSINVARDVQVFGWVNASYNVGGLIDYPLIFDCALSSSQIQTLFNNSGGIFEPTRKLFVILAPPTTAAPTTAAPTPAPTTVAPTTQAPTTVAPTTALPTPVPTTLAPTTLAPTTIISTTVAPTTNIPEEICIKNLNSTIAKELSLGSPITKEIRSDGYLC